MQRIIFLMFTLFSTAVFGADLQGDLSGNLAPATYHVTKDIFVKPGASLTIEPGAVLKFDSTVVFRVEGKLVAKGTPTKPILFSAWKKNPVGAAWEGIEFTNRSDNSSELAFCQVEFARRGVSLFSVSTEIHHCKITKNAESGIYCQVSQAKISQNEIQENGGDGIHASVLSGTILNNEISGNQGDGIYLENSKCLVANNQLRQNGDDGIFAKQSNALIRENLILQNVDDGILIDGAAPKILNNSIARNRFGVFGYNRARPLIVNNTIADNIFGLYGRNQTALTVDNSIVWRNQTNIFTDSISTAQISFSNVEGGFPGSGNLNTNPKFLNQEKYQLQSDSPCLGRGNPNPMIKESNTNSKNIGSSL